MNKDSNQKPHQKEENTENQAEEIPTQDEAVNEQASTYQPEVTHHGEQEVVKEQKLVNDTGKRQERSTKNKKINFDVEKSINETKGILKDAILKPHSLVSSSRTISIETSVIIFVLLSIIIGVVAYFSYRNLLGNLFGGFGGFFGAEVGISVMFQTMLGWLITFAVGYFSLYFILQYFGNRKMEHRELLTKYVTVSIPYVVVFCVVLLLFGFLMMDYFIIMYAFSLLLFGMIHIYLFLVNINEPKFDLFWMLTAYLFVLILLTYFIAGLDIPGF